MAHLSTHTTDVPQMPYLSRISTGTRFFGSFLICATSSGQPRGKPPILPRLPPRTTTTTAARATQTTTATLDTVDRRLLLALLALLLALLLLPHPRGLHSPLSP
jgi:hypothetical protein